MDPFSVALGVVQLTGVAIKLSLLLQKKLKVFRNYSREISRVFKAVNRQQKNFLHEIHLLLRLAKQDEDDIERMLQDAEDSQWSSLELQAGLDAAFPKSLDIVQDIIEDVKSTLQTLQGELACFDEIVRMGTKNEPIKDTVRRVRKKAKLTWNKVSFEEQIKSLRNLNDDLRRLREQAAEIRDPILRGTASVRPVHQLSQEYGSIGKVRRASKAFHQALAAAWLKDVSKTLPQEVRHNVKLKLDTQVRDVVKMEVVIACHGHSSLRPSCIQAGLVNVRVESQIIDFMDSGLNTPPNSSDDGRRKKRRVRFNFDDNREESTKVPTPTKSLISGMTDLGIVQNICTVLQGTSVGLCDSKCLGYLDNCCNDSFRHSFFGMAASRRPISESVCVSTEEILSLPAEWTVTLVDQLTLARNFAMAVLKFHSTPWLREYVSIQEFSFFRFDDSDLSSCIRTAHLGFDFAQASLCENVPIPMEDMGNSGAIEDAQLTHGVRNLTLWGLGTVMYVLIPRYSLAIFNSFATMTGILKAGLELKPPGIPEWHYFPPDPIYNTVEYLTIQRLQIGTWSTLKSPDDVVAVRRLAQKVPVLGRRYRDLTKQCLECDFAFGDDLSKPRLQQAVYEHVVCGLTDMIKALDLEEN